MIRIENLINRTLLWPEIRENPQLPFIASFEAPSFINFRFKLLKLAPTELKTLRYRLSRERIIEKVTKWKGA